MGGQGRREGLFFFFFIEINIGKTVSKATNSDFSILMRQEIHSLKGSFYFLCLATKNKENESTASL